MKKITPDLGHLPGIRVFGFLYEHDDKSVLGEDMLEAILLNGLVVEAGWYPEGGSRGAYRIVATDGSGQLLNFPFRTRDIVEAAEAVRFLAEYYFPEYETFSTETASTNDYCTI